MTQFFDTEATVFFPDAPTGTSLKRLGVSYLNTEFRPNLASVPEE